MNFQNGLRPRLTGNDRLFGMAGARAKRRLLAGARCLLFPVQWEEPFGMVMIEAMACGTPVVALRAGSVPEVVIDGSPASSPIIRRSFRRRCSARRAWIRPHAAAMSPGASTSRALPPGTRPPTSALETAGTAGRSEAGMLGTLRREYAGLDRALDRQFRQHSAHRAGQPTAGLRS
jgi:hypothetical protein